MVWENSNALKHSRLIQKCLDIEQVKNVFHSVSPEYSTAELTGQFTPVIHEEVLISRVLLIAETLCFAAVVYKG